MSLQKLIEEVEHSPAIAAQIVFDWVRRHPLLERGGERILPVCLWGERGVGKTQIVRGYCLKQNFGFRSYHPAHDQTGSDLVGLPMLNQELGRTEYAVPQWMPRKSEGVLLETQGVLFIDELNRAPLSVLQGLLQLIGEGIISHSNYEMPEGWGIITAANPPRDGYFVQELDDAMIDRLIHIPVAFDLARWIAWAEDAGLAQPMMEFAAQNRDLIPGSGSQLPESLPIEATPRSLEYLGRLYEPNMNRRLLITIGRGLVGIEATARFLHQLDNQGDRREPMKASDILLGAYTNGTAAYAPEADESTNDFLLAALMRQKPEEPSVSNVAAYLIDLPADQAKTMWERIGLDAPAWRKPLSEIIHSNRA